MKKICPLTFLTKLASLTNLTGRGTGQNLSNEKTLSTGQEELVSGCGPYRPAEPRIRGPYKPRRPSAADAQIESNIDEQVLSKDASALVSGSSGYKPPRIASETAQTPNSNNITAQSHLNTKYCALVAGCAGAKKPPRRAFSEAQKPNENSDKQLLSTKVCELVTGGVVAKKPPRVARVSTDLKPDNPMDYVQG
ncbi:hypothetical protein C3B51_19445 [Pseudoalteromonas rubra]|uniref:Uncharacterized protein n=1 Tax=Pseudoalteromonas rubra TaxID=43658 RepID=A0A4Q7E027_9GAMM|nr:hypothetical protein [Pseudoalteromonas rubra]RZM74778.1 hypothetical protein C3B51_19445 [Pseudoalteromonas rubra]